MSAEDKITAVFIVSVALFMTAFVGAMVWHSDRDGKRRQETMRVCVSAGRPPLECREASR